MMGWEIVDVKYRANVSRHNSPRDRSDDALWEDFLERVQTIADEDKYEKIQLREVPA